MKQGEPIHKGVILGFIAITLVFVVMGIILGHDIKKNNRAITQLRITKANVSQLQRSNCTIKTALLVARKLSYDRAIRQGKTRKQALATVTSLNTIIVGMDGEAYCPIPKKYQLTKGE